MRQISKLICFTIISCLSIEARAQFTDDDDELSDDLGLYYDEDEEEKPQHREYKNLIDVQYTPSRYTFHGASSSILSQGFALGWARSIQVTEDTPLFVELGAQMKYDFSGEVKDHQNASYRQLAFRIPANVVYKFYPSRTSSFALAPMAGVFCQVRAMGKEKAGGQSRNITDNGNKNTTGAVWKRFQLGWQAGLKMYWDRYYCGFTYAQDFHDRLVNDSSVDASKGEDKMICRMHEYSVHLGICF
jgi:hypothetical protein